MPSTAAAASTRKRKKTEDMSDSPPKRVTRARAIKAVPDAESGPKTTRITTTSARIAAEARAASASKPAAKSTRATKRKTKPETNMEDVIVVEDDVQQEAPKTRGRPKKTKETSTESATTSNKTRTRQTKTKDTEAQSSTQQPKPKTRTRKATTENQQVEVEKVEPIPAMSKRTTRARAGTASSDAQGSAPTKAATARKTTKKVTFQDDVSQDKENVPYSVETTKNELSKATGIKAKPIRRPATTRTTTRGKKAVGTEVDEKPTIQPLSPKKVTQVAKSSSNSSEDELGKSPIKPILKSPGKPRIETQQPRTPEKSPIQRDYEHTPMQSISRSLIASPAKRPPPSPFKDSLKQSPKKFSVAMGPSNLGSVPLMGPPAFTESLKQSPKRLNLTPARLQDQSKPTAGALARAALLGSPVRRPNSPLKFGSVRVPGKLGTTMLAPKTTSALRHVKNTSLFSATPKRLFGSSAKTAKNVGSPVKAPNVVPLETDEATTPAGTPKTVEKQSPRGFIKYNEANPVHFGEPEPVFERDIFADSVESPKFRCLGPESDSEDELLSGSPTMKASRKSTCLMSEASTPAPRSFATPRPRAKDLSMTPLAMQLSSWLAASPAKSDEDEGISATDTRDVYTPVFELLRNRSGENSRRTTITPVKPTFFEEQLPAEIAAPPLLEEMQQQDFHISEDIEMIDVVENDLSQESDQYGDENITPRVVGMPESRDDAATVTPARVFDTRPKEVRTVSRVPLKPASDETPIKLKVKKSRSKSLGGPLVELDLSEDPLVARGLLRQNATMVQQEETMDVVPSMATPRSISQPLPAPQTPANELASLAGTPFKSVRKGADAQILRGAVVHVDVHTTEGADASSIFVELLTQMGARCVKQWSWNPRTSLAAGEDPTANGKVGITHVVFKDGSKRTLQKVREAKGLVLCVGVGWVLE